MIRLRGRSRLISALMQNCWVLQDYSIHLISQLHTIHHLVLGWVPKLCLWGLSEIPVKCQFLAIVLVSRSSKSGSSRYARKNQRSCFSPCLGPAVRKLTNKTKVTESWCWKASSASFSLNPWNHQLLFCLMIDSCILLFLLEHWSQANCKITLQIFIREKKTTLGKWILQYLF